MQAELKEFIELSTKVKGHWQVWPTHWAGGTNSVKVDGENTIWVDSNKGGEVCRFKTQNNCVTQDMYARAGFIARSRNISPTMAQCLLQTLVAAQKNIQFVRDEQDEALALAMEGQLQQILDTWEAAA